MNQLILFAHGKESGPWGSKIQLLAKRAALFGASVLSPDYSKIADPDERVEYLLNLTLPPHDNLIMVGSSMGGYVSTLASKILQPQCLFLMAPAFYMPGYLEQNPQSYAKYTSVVFGRHDEVIPVENGIRFANTNNVDLHIVNGNHRLDSCINTVVDLFTLMLVRHGTSVD